ncbi:MAG: peptidylprolyl isomerase [Leptolyngbyaceae cyanobacterium bins.59]|nr:peptidylprolyl isomerase [Leptolyngbyaceae cyanobacterium bins.59]
MTAELKVFDQTIPSEALLPLLAKYRMLPQFLREIVIDQAIAGVEVTPEEKELAYQGFCRQQQLDSPDKQGAWLAQQGMTIEQLEQLILRDLQLEKFKQETWGPQLESYFLQRKSQLDRVVYSLIRTQNIGIAQELFFRIQEGEQSFAELAQQYSQGPEAQTGGLVGPAELHTLHPSLSQLLMVSKPGQLWPPCQVGDWIVVVRLEKLLPTQLDDPMRQRLLNECFTDWIQQKVQQVIAEMAPTSSIA